MENSGTVPAVKYKAPCYTAIPTMYTYVNILYSVNKELN